MGLPRVRIVNKNKRWVGTECYVDGKEIPNIKSIDFRVAVDEVPTYIVEAIGIPDIEMCGKVELAATPTTVGQSIRIIREELEYNRDYYDTLVKEMCSALDDSFRKTRDRCGDNYDIGEKDFEYAAKLMLNKLFDINGNGDKNDI